jgi:hypothetical protein
MDGEELKRALLDKSNYMDAAAAAKYIGYAENTLQYWRTHKIGPKYFKPAGKILYLKQDLDDWMNGEYE